MKFVELNGVCNTDRYNSAFFNAQNVVVHMINKYVCHMAGKQIMTVTILENKR